MSVSDSWSERSRASGKSGSSASTRRSLKDALSDAGLADPKPHRVSLNEALRAGGHQPRSVGDAVRSALRVVAEGDAASTAANEGSEYERAATASENQPSSSLKPVPSCERNLDFTTVEEAPSLLSTSSRSDTTHGVVSPPPWLRAARRGRRKARALNAAGWFVTIMVVGSIITVAGRFLAVSPGGESFYTARQ